MIIMNNLYVSEVSSSAPRLNNKNSPCSSTSSIGTSNASTVIISKSANQYNGVKNGFNGVNHNNINNNNNRNDNNNNNKKKKNDKLCATENGYMDCWAESNEKNAAAAPQPVSRRSPEDIEPEKFVAGVLHSLLNPKNYGRFRRTIEIIGSGPHFIDDPKVLYEFFDITAFMISLTRRAILDHIFGSLHESISKFYVQFCGALFRVLDAEIAGIEDDRDRDRDDVYDHGYNDHLVLTSIKPQQPMKHLTIEFLNESSAHLLSAVTIGKKSSDPPDSTNEANNNSRIIIITETLPLALTSLLTLGVTYFEIRQLSTLIENISTIKRHVDGRLVDHHDISRFIIWKNFARQYENALTIYRTLADLAANCDDGDAVKRRLEETTLRIVKCGIENQSPQNYSETIDREREHHPLALDLQPYYRLIGRKAVNDIAAVSRVSRLQLFLFFQKQIAALLLRRIEAVAAAKSSHQPEDKINNNNNNNNICSLLFDGMRLFGIRGLPSELLRWIIPAVVVRRDAVTKAILDGFAAKMRLAPEYPIKNWINQIMMHIFYDRAGDCRLVYDVFRFASDHAGRDLFSLIGTDLSFTNDCLALYGTNRAATLRALSFACAVSNGNVTYIDPGRPDAILDVDLDAFSRSEQNLKRFLQNHFPAFMHQVDLRFAIVKKQFKYTIEDKTCMLQSYRDLLRLLGDDFVIRHRVRIYFTIRCAFTCGMTTPDFVSIAFEILSDFIRCSTTEFLRAEIPSISMLILPLLKRYAKHLANVFERLLSRPYPRQLYHQLYFIPDIGPFSGVIRLIRCQTGAAVDSQIDPSIIGDDDDDENDAQQQQQRFVSYIESDKFGRRCRDIIFVADHINHEEAAIRQMALSHLHERIAANRIIFNRLAAKCTISGGDIEQEPNLKSRKKVSKRRSSSSSSSQLYDTYANLSLNLLQDGFDGATQFDRRMYDRLLSIECVSDFFRYLIGELMRCSVFAADVETRNLAGTCIGALGAIDTRWLRYDRASLRDDFHRPKPPYSRNISSGSTSSGSSKASTAVITMSDIADISLDNCNRRLFRHQTRDFKRILMHTLMSAAMQTTDLTQFLISRKSMQRLAQLFADAKQCSLLDRQACAIDSDGRVIISAIESYIARQLGSSKGIAAATTATNGTIAASKAGPTPSTAVVAGPSTAAGRPITITTKTPINEASRLQMLDEVELMLETEKIEPIVPERDLPPDLAQFIDVSQATSTSKRRRIPPSSITIDRFFASLHPGMSYEAFVTNLLKMLYHCFLVDANGVPVTAVQTNRFVSYQAIFSQATQGFHQSHIQHHHQQHQTSSASSASCQNSGGANPAEYDNIISKLETIQMPIQIFLTCYHSILNNLKLAHLLLPGLLVVALSVAEADKQEYFCRQLRSLICDRLVTDSRYFAYELGPLAAELICALYDFLHDFDCDRRVVHRHIIPRLAMRNRVSRFDAEYSGVRALLKFMQSRDMARLAYAAGSHHRALQYLERSFADLRDRSVSPIAIDDFVDENLLLLMRIFDAIADRESVRGCARICRSQFGELSQMFLHRIDGGASDRLQSLLIGAKLFRKRKCADDYDDYDDDYYYANQQQQQLELERHPHDDNDLEEKYLRILASIDQDLTLFAPKLRSDFRSDALKSGNNQRESNSGNHHQHHHRWSSIAPLYMIESAWKLAQWDAIDPIASLLHPSAENFLPNSKRAKTGNCEFQNSQHKTRQSIESNFGTNSAAAAAASHTTSSTFVPNIGNILLGLRNSEPLFELECKFADLRSNLMAPLRAAMLANHRVAYARAYQDAIVPLHALYDVQHFAQTVYVRLMNDDKQNESLPPQPEPQVSSNEEDNEEAIAASGERSSTLTSSSSGKDFDRGGNSNRSSSNSSSAEQPDQQQMLLTLFRETIENFRSRNQILSLSCGGGSGSNNRHGGSGSDTVLQRVLDVQRALVRVIQQHALNINNNNNGNYRNNRRRRRGGGFNPDYDQESGGADNADNTDDDYYYDQQQQRQSGEKSPDLFALDLFRYWNESLRASLAAGRLDRAYGSMIEAIDLRNRAKSTRNISFAVDDDEHARFVMDCARVYWCSRDSDAALSLLRSEIDRAYGDLKQHCCMATVKVFAATGNSNDMMEIAKALGLNVDTSTAGSNGGPSCSTSSGGFGMPAVPRIRHKIAQIGARQQSNGAETSGGGGEPAFSLESISRSTRQRYGEMQLQYARYLEESRQFSANPLMAAFKAVTIACPEWEEGHYQLAMFCLALVKEYRDIPAIMCTRTQFATYAKAEEMLELKNRIVKQLIESLKHGNKFVAVSLPILVNTWIEMGYEYNQLLQSANGSNSSGGNNSKNSSSSGGISGIATTGIFLNGSNSGTNSAKLQQSYMGKLREMFRRCIEICTNLIKQLAAAETTNKAIFLLVTQTLITHMLHPVDVIAATIRGELLAMMIANFPHHMSWEMSRSSLSSGRRGAQSKEVQHMAITRKAPNELATTGSSATTAAAATTSTATTTTSTTTSPMMSSKMLAKYMATFKIFTNYINQLSQYKPPKQATIQANAKANRTAGPGPAPPAPPASLSSSSTDFSLRKTFPQFMKMIENLADDDYHFVMPCNQFFLPSLLNLARANASSSGTFDRFFAALYIERLDDTAQTMKSLQMPKRITFVCRDGRKRTLLCKSFDDLRKDRCMLAFCNLFNRCYRGEIPQIESMQRTVQNDVRLDAAEERQIWSRRAANSLAAKSYYACPLSDHFGVIEWIPGLQSMKSLIETQYNRDRASKFAYQQAKTRFIRGVMQTAGSKVTREKRIANFVSTLSLFAPPVFHRWFDRHFADAYSWYVASRNFTRTSAVYSVLGYALGLGDRHAENILIDPASGEVVQVDFNCLFNKGEEFLVPECVPFRLTHNMVAAMGVVGPDGQFRHTAEDVMLVLRQYRKLFAEHVTMFLYDPLQEWIDSGDRNEAAEKAIYGVEARLCGIISRSLRNLPKGKIVSIRGQIDYTIKEATDINNLGSMYHGWASYI